MILGRVIGHVWAARRDARLQRAKLLVIRPHAIYEPAFATRHLVATDDVDAGVGDDVIVCLGAPARVSAGGNDMPVDAAVLGVVDRIDWQRGRDAGAGRGARNQARPRRRGRAGAQMIRGTVIGHVWATRKARGPGRADAAAGRGARRRGTDDGPAGGRERHAGRARRRGRDGRVRLGRAQRAAPRRRRQQGRAVRRGHRRDRGRSGLDVSGTRRGNRLVDCEVAFRAGPEAAARAPVPRRRSGARCRPGGGRGPPRSRPTIWSSARTRWTPGRAMT